MAEEGRPAPKRRKWPRRLALTLGALLLAVLGLVVGLLYAPPLSRLAVSTALARWDAGVPASVDYEQIEGSLGGEGLRIHGLHIVDSEGATLLQLDSFELELSPLALLRKQATVDLLAVRGASVYLDHRWQDLGSGEPKPEQPKQPKGSGNFELPLGVHLQIELEQLRLLQDEQAIVELETSTLALSGEGRHAELDFGLDALELASAPAPLQRASLRLVYDAPQLRVEGLELDTPLAQLRLSEIAHVQLPSQRADLGLRIDAELEAIDASFGLRERVPGMRLPEQLGLNLQLSGRPSAGHALLELELGEDGALRLEASATHEPESGAVAALARLDAELSPQLLDPRQPGLTLEARAWMKRPGAPEGQQAPVSGALALRVHEQRTGQTLLAHADLPHLNPSTRAGELALELRGLGLALAAQLELAADPTQSRGELQLRVPELARPLALVAALLDQPALTEVRGGLSVDSSCAPSASDPQGGLACPAQLRLAAFEGFGAALGEAELSGQVQPLGDASNSEPSFDLKLAARELSLNLGEGQAYAFTQLDTQLRGRPSALELQADGRGPKDALELALAVQDLPEQGGRELRFDTLRATTSRMAVLAGVELQSPGALRILDDHVELGGLQLRAFGARVSAEGELALVPERSHDLRVDLRGLDLARLDAALPGPQMSGRVDLHAELRGPLDELRGQVQLDGAQLQIAELELGELSLHVHRGMGTGTRGSDPAPAFVSLAKQGATGKVPPSRPRPRAGDLVTELTLAGPLLRRVDLYASVPVDGLALGSGPSTVRLALEDFALEELGALMPETPLWWDATGDSAAPPVDTLWIPEGRIDLDFSLDGPLARPQLALALRGARLELDRAQLGSLALFARYDPRAQELQLEAQVQPRFIDGLDARARIPLALDLRHGRVRWLESREHQLAVDLSGFELAALTHALAPSLPALTLLDQLPLHGEFAAGLRVAGLPADPAIDLRVHGRELALASTEIGQLRVDLGYAHEALLAQLALDSPYAERLDAQLQLPLQIDLGAEQPVQLAGETPLSGAVHAEALALAELGALVGTELDGLASAHVELGGSLADPHANARLALLELGLGRGEVGNLSAELEFEDEQAQVELELLRSGRHILSLSAAVPVLVDLLAETPSVAWQREGSHRVRVAADGIDHGLLASLAELPPDLELDANFALRGGGALADFNLDAELDGQLHKGEPRRDSSAGTPVAFRAQLHANEALQRLGLELIPQTPDAERAGLQSAVELGLPVPAYLAGEHRIADTRYQLELHAPHFELTDLAGFLPGSLHDPQGVLVAEISGAGVLATPELEGELRVAETAITVVPLRQRLADIELELDFSHEHAQLRTLHVGAGKGALDGKGRIDVLPELGLDGALELEIDDFPLVREGVPPIAFATVAELELHTRPDDLELSIALREPTLSVAGKAEGAPKPVPTSESIRFLDAGEPAWDELSLEPVEEDSGRMRIALELVDPLRIVGSPIDMAWGGALEVEREGSRLEVSGQLDTRGGRIELAGKQFTIQRGTVALPQDGQVDPYIDLIAATEVGDVEIRAQISGRVSKPQLHFSSTPGYSEYEIFSLLVTGSPTPGEAARSKLEVQAASLLAAVSSPQLQRKIEETLRIDRAKLEFGETIDQPILTVGKRVSRKVYLETSYHHNAPPDENTAEVRVEYDFARRWSLQTHFGDAAVGGVGAFWSRSLAAPAWKVSAQERAAERERRRATEQGEDESAPQQEHEPSD